MYNFRTSYDVYINSSKYKRYYSKKKAINIAQVQSENLFLGHRHVEVVDTYTGEIIWNS